MDRIEKSVRTGFPKYAMSTWRPARQFEVISGFTAQYRAERTGRRNRPRELKGEIRMTTIRKKLKKRKSQVVPSIVRRTEGRAASEVDFKGPNVNKRHRKPDEIYGDISIPDSARKE